jgi:hypothetical protein
MPFGRRLASKPSEFGHRPLAIKTSRVMIMKQAIEYNFAVSAKNEPNGTVHFMLKGDSDRLDAALVAIYAYEVS